MVFIDGCISCWLRVDKLAFLLRHSSISARAVLVSSCFSLSFLIVSLIVWVQLSIAKTYFAIRSWSLMAVSVSIWLTFSGSWMVTVPLTCCDVWLICDTNFWSVLRISGFLFSSGMKIPCRSSERRLSCCWGPDCLLSYADCYSIKNLNYRWFAETRHNIPMEPIDTSRLLFIKDWQIENIQVFCQLHFSVNSQSTLCY